jgi:hypothetical protein
VFCDGRHACPCSTTSGVDRPTCGAARGPDEASSRATSIVVRSLPFALPAVGWWEDPRLPRAVWASRGRRTIILLGCNCRSFSCVPSLLRRTCRRGHTREPAAETRGPPVPRASRMRTSGHEHEAPVYIIMERGRHQNPVKAGVPPGRVAVADGDATARRWMDEQ